MGVVIQRTGLGFNMTKFKSSFHYQWALWLDFSELQSGGARILLPEWDFTKRVSTQGTKWKSRGGPWKCYLPRQCNSKESSVTVRLPELHRWTGTHSAPGLVKNMRASPITPHSKGYGPQLWFHIRFKLNHTYTNTDAWALIKIH